MAAIVNDLESHIVDESALQKNWRCVKLGIVSRPFPAAALHPGCGETELGGSSSIKLPHRTGNDGAGA